MARRKALAASLKKYQSCKLTKEELRKILASGIFGRVTGVIGPFVLRYRNGKLIISDRPKLFRMSMSRAAVEGRKNFSASVSYAKFLNDIPLVKSAWEQADIKGRAAWNRMIKYNHTTDLPGLHNSITPIKNQFEIGQICRLDINERIIIDAENQFSAGDTLIIMIVPFDPVSKKFEIIGFSTSLNKKEIELNEDQKSICGRYVKYLIYTAVIRRNGNKLEWSNTAVSEGTIIREIEPVTILFIYREVSLYGAKINILILLHDRLQSGLRAMPSLGSPATYLFYKAPQDPGG